VQNVQRAAMRGNNAVHHARQAYHMHELLLKPDYFFKTKSMLVLNSHAPSARFLGVYSTTLLLICCTRDETVQIKHSSMTHA
jgi:hypothetical protein